jgi:hypothetical protein
MSDPITFEPTRVSRGNGKPLWSPAGSKAGVLARLGRVSATGETKAEATSALISDLAAQAETVRFVWSPGGTLFLVKGLGFGSYGYEIVKPGRSSGCLCICGATMDEAQAKAESHAASYEG